MGHRAPLHAPQQAAQLLLKLCLWPAAQSIWSGKEGGGQLLPSTVTEDMLEWSGSSLSTVFTQRLNLLRPRFWGMLRELMRFNRLCTALRAASCSGVRVVTQRISDADATR